MCPLIYIIKTKKEQKQVQEIKSFCVLKEVYYVYGELAIGLSSYVAAFNYFSVLNGSDISKLSLRYLSKII